MSGVIDVAPHASAADGDRAGRKIDSRVFDGRESDYQTVMANSQTACVVPAAADRHKQIVCAGESHGRDHIGNVRASSDQARLFMDHCVIDRTSLIVINVARLDESASEASF